MQFRQAIEPRPLVSLGDQSASSAFPGDQPAGFDFSIRRGHADVVSLAKRLDGNRALGGILLHLRSFLPVNGLADDGGRRVSVIVSMTERRKACKFPSPTNRR